MTAIETSTFSCESRSDSVERVEFSIRSGKVKEGEEDRIIKPCIDSIKLNSESTNLHTTYSSVLTHSWTGRERGRSDVLFRIIREFSPQIPILINDFLQIQ